MTSGSFDVSFDSSTAGGIGESASFDCQGSVDGAEISASKSTVYSAGSAESEITVTIEDEDGTAATPGGDVDFTTNACVFGNGKNAMKLSLRQTATTQSPKPPWTARPRVPVLPRSWLRSTSPVATSF